VFSNQNKKSKINQSRNKT